MSSLRRSDALLGSWQDGQPYLSIDSIHIKFIDFSVVPLVIAMAGIVANEARIALRTEVKVFIAMIVPLITFLVIGS